MHKVKIRVLLFLIFILISTFLGGCSRGFLYNYPKVEEGNLDLTHWRLEADVIKLDGQWEFYYNQMLTPQSLKHTQKTGYINVPGSWNRYVVNGKELSGNGYATYRMFYKTESSQKLGVKIPKLFTSYRLWVNGKLIASAGEVGKSRESMVPQYLPQIALFESEQGENEIVLQVANFYHRSGGILESLILGNEKQILDMRYKRIAYDLFLFGSLIIMGVYHIFLFVFRRKDTAPLYFGLFCIFVGTRTLLVGECFLIHLIPNFNWEVAHKIQTLIFYIGVPLIALFFKAIFPKYFYPRIIRTIQIIGIAFGCLVILTPARIFTVFNPVYQIFTVIVIVYIISVFISMFLRKEEEIGFIIVGALALFLTSLNDIVFLSIWMNDQGFFLRNIFRTGNLSSIGQLIFVFANSLVLARRFSRALNQEEVMTAQLKEVNLNLDKIVTKRTESLEQSLEKIADQKLDLEKANQALQLLSLKDPLTGLWNRRHYDATSLLEWNRNLRNKRAVSLMMLDIDNFKEFNDCYGHNAGDECLIKIAKVLKDTFKRSSDLAARFGGEEFIVLMPEVEKEETIKMAHLVQENIKYLRVPHKYSSTGPYVTVSIGVASMIPDIDCSYKDLFLAADKALYRAKEAGRNTVEF